MKTKSHHRLAAIAALFFMNIFFGSGFGQAKALARIIRAATQI